MADFSLHLKHHPPAGCRNPKCPAGCGFYLAPTDRLAPDTPCSVCGCLLAQHLETLTAPVQEQAQGARAAEQGSSSSGAAEPGLPRNGPSVFTSRQSNNSSNSSTFPSTSKSTSSSLAGQNGVPTVFRDKLKDMSRFNPAGKSLQDFYASLPGKQTNGKGPAPGSKTFTAIFLPYTYLVSTGDLRRFGIATHRLLLIAGLVKQVTLHPSFSDQRVLDIILTAFQHVPEIAQFGFRLLCVEGSGQGASARIVPLDMQTSYQGVLLASGGAALRGQSASFPTPFYISLPPEGPDLVLDGKDLSRATEGETSQPPAETRERGGKRKASPIEISDSEEAIPFKRRRAQQSGGGGDDDGPAPSKGTKRKAPENDDDSEQPSRKAAGSKKPARPLKTDESDDDGRLPSPTRFTWAQKGKGKAKQETPFQQGVYDDDLAAGISSDDDRTRTKPATTGPAPAAGSAPSPAPPSDPLPTYSAAHLSLTRLIANMSNNMARATIFVRGLPLAVHPFTDNLQATAPSGFFGRGLSAAAIITTFFEAAKNTETGGVIALTELPNFVATTIEGAFGPLYELINRMGPVAESHASVGLEAEFDEQVFLGTGGVHGLVLHLDAAYIALRDLSWRDIPGLSVHRGWQALERLSSALLYAVQHIRFRLPRSAWDPHPAFRDLQSFLDAHDGELPGATRLEFDRLRLQPVIAAIKNLDTHVLIAQLIQSFGDAADSKEMNKERLLRGGEFGLRRVYGALVVPLLDEHDTTRPGYSAILTILETFFEAVMRLLRNWQKSKKTGSSSAQPKATSSKPGTRSRRDKDEPDHDDDPDWKPDDDNTPSSSGTGFQEDAADDEDSTDEKIRRQQQRWRDLEAEKKRRKAEADARAQQRVPKSANASGSRPRPRPYYSARPGPAPKPRQSAPQPAPASVPLPAPHWINAATSTTTDLRDAANILASSQFWSNVVENVLQRFPHPDVTRRAAGSALLAASRTRQYHGLALLYHPDRNMSESAHFRAIAVLIMQVVNTAKVTKA
uniref:J domain-containing protein n=1 Tax=Mycena chlorophos TaxID=658473 RepID=A0ABQ0L8A2_MYCCL|nr:predicted protein [Mycena chlorophos]